MSELLLPVSPIDFDEQAHIYSHNGIKLPSVTQIMKPMSMMVYGNVSSEKLNIAADRGTRAHEQISNMVKYGISEEDADTAPYIEAYRKFIDAVKPNFIESEYRTHHKLLKYAGTIDLIGYIEPDDGNGVDVIDIKTTAAFHKVMLSTQLGAYAKALESHGIKTRNYYGLQLLKNGTYKFRKVEDGFTNFLFCLGIYNAMAEEMI